ncbi:MAG: acylphosphatase [Planctomycetota bacterium]|nr:acylphosphatase [Planctomycetota bacterium]
MIRRTVHFSGRVQGVGFRYTTCRISARFAVTGYVRNLPDGRVEAVMEGRTTEITQFVDSIAEQMRGFIGEIAVVDSGATGEFDQFEVRS